jgi:hypothetical protein
LNEEISALGAARAENFTGNSLGIIIEDNILVDLKLATGIG